MLFTPTPVTASDCSLTGPGRALKRVFQTLHANSCPHEYNFHMHTTCSDGRLHPEASMQQAIEIGLKGLAITDHHSVDAYGVAKRWLNEWQGSQGDESVAPTLWTGVEISADLLDTAVHILGYAFDLDHQAMEPYLQGHIVTGDGYQADRVIEAIHQAGGLAVLAHPARYRRSPTELIPEAARLGIDGSEAYYAYKNPKPWQPSPQQTEQIRSLNDRYGLLDTCGTDSHGINLLQHA